MSRKVYDYAFFEGQVTNIHDAKVSIMTNALQYGTGIFAGIRAYYDKANNQAHLFRLGDHYQRFIGSSKILGTSLPYGCDELMQITVDLIKKNQPTCDTYLRPFGYVGNTELGPNLANAVLDFALYMISLDEYLPVDKGLSLTVSSWRRISDNAIPSRAKASGGYINSALARKEATDGGFDEAILLNENGTVSEGSAENLFLLRNGTLVTPAFSDNILEGITRRTIVELAEEMGIPVEARSVAKTELYIAEEVFLVGTGVQLAWVDSVDKRQIGEGKIGPIAKKLQEKYFTVVRGTDGSHPEWRTTVKLG